LRERRLDERDGNDAGGDGDGGVGRHWDASGNRECGGGGDGAHPAPVPVGGDRGQRDADQCGLYDGGNLPNGRHHQPEAAVFPRCDAQCGRCHIGHDPGPGGGGGEDV